MSFRSGINTVNAENSAAIRTFSKTTNPVVSGTRNSTPITLPVGTYKCSLSYQLNFTGTGSVLMTSLNTGLSGDAGISAIPPQPLSATSSTIIYAVGSQTFNAGTGFADFKETFITLSAPTTIYLGNTITFVLNAGTPVVNITQSPTVTEIIG
jgi:hypothetical protein